MSALPEAPARRRLHTRRIEIEGFLREDGLFDLEASLCDHKDADYRILSGLIPAGAPVHLMQLRLTIDRNFNIEEAWAHSAAAPYGAACQAINPAYAALKGLNLFQGFRRAVQERWGDTQGCTHLTELLFALPTAALQTLATLLREDASEDKPFQLDRCHALASEGEVVRRYFPRWYRPASPAKAPQDQG